MTKFLQEISFYLRTFSGAKLPPYSELAGTQLLADYLDMHYAANAQLVASISPFFTSLPNSVNKSFTNQV